MYKQYYIIKKKNKNIQSFFEPGDLVGFKRFFKNKEGKICSLSNKNNEFFIVSIDGVTHEIHYLDMYPIALTRRVIIEKYYRF